MMSNISLLSLYRTKRFRGMIATGNLWCEHVNQCFRLGEGVPQAVTGCLPWSLHLIYGDKPFAGPRACSCSWDGLLQASISVHVLGLQASHRTREGLTMVLEIRTPVLTHIKHFVLRPSPQLCCVMYFS